MFKHKWLFILFALAFILYANGIFKWFSITPLQVVVACAVPALLQTLIWAFKLWGEYYDTHFKTWRAKGGADWFWERQLLSEQNTTPEEREKVQTAIHMSGAKADALG